MIHHPLTNEDKNGTEIKIFTYMFSLRCFCCLNVNMVYKAAVFSGAHFQKCNDFRRNMSELESSPIHKFTTTSTLEYGRITLACELHYLFELNVFNKDVICSSMFFWNLIRYLINSSKWLKLPTKEHNSSGRSKLS